MDKKSGQGKVERVVLVLLIFLVLGLLFMQVRLDVKFLKEQTVKEYYKSQFMQSCELNNNLITNLDYVAQNTEAEKIGSIDCNALIIKEGK